MDQFIKILKPITPPAALLALLLLNPAARLAAEVRLVPDNRIARIGAMDEPLPLQTLIRASLIASDTSGFLNISDISSDSKVPLADDLAALLKSAPNPAGDQAAAAEELLQWMHKTLLTRYVESQTRIDTLLNNGRYNCVSSAVIYMMLLRSRGIPVHGVLTPDHAFIRLPQIAVDVETTIPFGFNPGVRREAVDSFTGRTGFTYVPPGDYKRRRNIGEKQLISLIYQNRIAVLQRSGKWSAAVGLARDRWALAGSKEARNDFRDSLVNYAAEADRRGNNLQALQVIAEAAAMFEGGPKLKQAAAALVGNEIARALRAGRTQAARDALQAALDPAAAGLFPPQFIESRRRDIAAEVLRRTVETADFADAAKAVNTALASGDIPRDRWENFALHLWSTEARRRSRGGQWVNGWDFLQTAPSKIRSIPQWPSLLDTYSHNAVVSIHNRFVKAFRGQQWDRAAAALSEGLRRFPTHSTLLADRRTLQARQNQ